MNRTKNPKYFVSRQHYWESGVYAVEIARGGRDYSGPDMLCTTYSSLGEGDEFFDPREAVKAALAIADKWRESKPVKMVFGQNLDLVCADPVSYTEAKRKFPKIAKRLYEATEKCDWCGDILKDETWTDEFGEQTFCREYCAEEASKRYECAECGMTDHPTSECPNKTESEESEETDE